MCLITNRRAVEGLDSDVVGQRCQEFHQQVADRHHPRYVGLFQHRLKYIKHTHTHVYTVSRKKVPTFKLSVTLSNLNRFANFLHCCKVYEICYETHHALPTST